jgi:VWFA-related protein
MRRWLIAVIGVIGVTTCAGLVAAVRSERATTPAADIQEAGPAFRASAETVVVDVSVEERGRPLRGLQVLDFEIRDNGVPQIITDLSYEQLPIDVTIAFDLSASVTGYVLDQLRRAMRQLRADLRAGDRLKIVTFNHRIARIVDLSEPVATIDDAFTRLQPAGSSAILDALAVTLAAPTTPDRRYLTMLFSDGHDTSSVNDPSTLLAIVRRTRPTIVAVLPSDLIRPSAIRSDEVVVRPDLGTIALVQQVYSVLAMESGGRTITIRPNQNLSQTFTEALGQFRASYVLHFTPTGVAPDGVHQLAVRVKRDGVEVRARREYVRR